MGRKGVRFTSPTHADDQHCDKKLKLSPEVWDSNKSLCSKSLLKSVHPNGVLPSGNQILGTHRWEIRQQGLGKISLLSDTLVIHVLGFLSASDLLCLSRVSRTLFAFSRHEQLWKEQFLRRSSGNLSDWEGTWRKTYLVVFGCRPDTNASNDTAWEWLCDDISVAGLYSDVLFQPFLCARTFLDTFFFPHPNQIRSTIPRHSASSLDRTLFRALYASEAQPLILTDAISQWPCFGKGMWSLQSLLSRFKDVNFRAEAFDCPLSVYASYIDNCANDDCPLYLFDSKFVEKTGGAMGNEYQPPEIFGQDLFEVLGSDRPDYRWLIMGPCRSGSTFHKDPNGSAAWNAVLQGRKGWVLFHPDTSPPGVYTNEDESEVTAPLSLAEWFLGYFENSWELYGPYASDPMKRGRMLVGVCEPGEVVYIPSGWWHLVVNIEDSVALTQNFVSDIELSGALGFMRDKSDQLSGFTNILPKDVYTRFTEALRVSNPTLLEAIVSPGRACSRHGSLWDSMIQDGLERVAMDGFTFGFDVDSEDTEQCEL